MKPSILSLFLSAVALIAWDRQAVAQDGRTLQYFRTPGHEGINQFEPPKANDTVLFNGIKVRLGGDFALQFQSLDHRTGSGDTLANLGSNFNLPTANLNLDVQLADGVRMNLVTYLSSRYHPEAWVKGGYLQVDKLNFIEKDFLKGLMQVLTIKVGLDEINYGDAHFRRTDNARAIYNPFVGNYIMDAFVTEAFGEAYLQKNGFLLVAGVSNGNLNQSPVKGTKKLQPSTYGKLGFDRQFNEGFRARLTGSFYLSPGYDNGQYLYNGDRTGARYYNVMQPYDARDNFRSGRFSPGFWKFSAFQVNPFVKWHGLEFFGIYELVEGHISRTQQGGSYTQMAAELLYRIGKSERFYVGGRYNIVTGRDTAGAAVKTIDRYNVGGGCFLTDQIMMKVEYVDQKYTGNGWSGSLYQGGGFRGVMVEAAIGF